MRHCVISRFNIKWKNISNYDEWLEERLRLLSTYCLPSLNKQIYSNFEYYLCIDSNTNKYMLDKLDSLLSSYPMKSKILKFKNLKDFKINLENNFKSGSCILSRIDSDDAVSKEYTMNIQKFYNNRENRKIVFDYIYLYYFDSKKNKLVRANYPSTTMFLSLINYDKLTPYTHPHDRYRHLGYSIYKTKSKDAVCICHGGNIANGVDKAIKKFNAKVVKYNIKGWWK